MLPILCIVLIREYGANFYAARKRSYINTVDGNESFFRLSWPSKHTNMGILLFLFLYVGIGMV